jgi:uncharacterized protein (TIGR02145 family)
MKMINKKLIFPIAMVGFIVLFSTRCKKDNEYIDTVTDIDGNVYHTVTIGTQIWMVENLKTMKFFNGDLIPNITDDMEWSDLTIGAYCNYNNDTNYVITYGRLYNWYAVNDPRGLAPKGWHVATDSEWTTLTNYLGGDSVAGGKMKEIGTTHWHSPNPDATNESGFSALPGGYRFFTIGEEFGNIGHTGGWWSSSEGNSNVIYWYMFCIDSWVHRSEGLELEKNIGLSVRCVKD